MYAQKQVRVRHQDIAQFRSQFHKDHQHHLSTSSVGIDKNARLQINKLIPCNTVLLMGRHLGLGCRCCSEQQPRKDGHRVGGTIKALTAACNESRKRARCACEDINGPGVKGRDRITKVQSEGNWYRPFLPKIGTGMLVRCKGKGNNEVCSSVANAIQHARLANCKNMCRTCI
jgi:hypothetical protein